MIAAYPATADASLRTVLAALSRPVVELDAQGTLTYVNDAFVGATGWEPSEIVGAAWDELVAPDCETRRLVAAALGGLAGQGTGDVFTRGGERCVVTWDVVPMPHADGMGSGVVCVGSAVMGQRHAERERAGLAGALDKLSDRDPVTGLANARGFTRETAHAVRVAARARRADAVVCVRVHELAVVSAAYGVSAAEDALCGIAETLRAAIRDSDIIARVAADLFAIYAVGTTSPEHGAATAVRLRSALEQQNRIARAAGRAFDVVCTTAAAERAPGDEIEPWVARVAALVPVADEVGAVHPARSDLGVRA